MHRFEKQGTAVCYYHQQPIEWFCLNSRCLMPICKQCQPIHQQKHKNKVTVMKLVPMAECLDNAQQSIRKLLAPLKKSREEYEDIVAKKLESMEASLEQCRVRILAQVAKQFDTHAHELMLKFKSSFQKLRLSLDQQVLEMDRRLLHLQIPELSMKSFIQYYRDEDSTYKYISELSKKIVKADIAVPVLLNNFNVEKWIRIKRVKHHEPWLEDQQPYSTQPSTAGVWAQPKDGGVQSDEDESMEERLRSLKQQNDRLILLLKNNGPA